MKNVEVHWDECSRCLFISPDIKERHCYGIMKQVDSALINTDGLTVDPNSSTGVFTKRNELVQVYMLICPHRSSLTTS